MKKISFLMAALFTLLFITSHEASAHYGMIVPSDQMVMQGENSTVHLDLLFTHPMEGKPMPLDKPAKFSVFDHGKSTDLLETLQSAKNKDKQAWAADYKLKRPGIYNFYMEPTPYWEPAEDIYIVHHTKVAVAAFGDEQGWDEPLGVKTEIVPLTRPFGLYTGNVFQGVIYLNGKPVPNGEVEIEYYNKDNKYHHENDYMITQVIKADQNGVFTYAAPVAGWWGFAALNTADYTIKHDGVDKQVELGAVIWVNFQDMK